MNLRKPYKCPVCGGVTITIEEWSDGQSIVLESDTTCENGDYSYQFEHGMHWVRVNDREWEWSYAEAKGAKMRQEIESYIATLKDGAA